MKKKYIILIFLLISLFIFFSNLESIRPVVTKYLSTEAKIKIKELIFGKKRMKIIHEYTNMNYNQTLLPETQFTNINLKEIPLHNFTRKKEDGYINSKNSDISAKFFIGQFNDDLVIVDEIGRIFFINMQFIPDFKDFNWVRVNSNLNSPDIKIKDILLSNNEIYISYSETTSEKCSTINISKAKILKKELNFKIFFKSEECKMAFTAGRMVFYNHEDRDGLLLTTSANYGLKNLAQDDNSVFGKILFIDLETKKHIIFSKGHRVPQGLTIENNSIISTEHGPRGGDEINLIQFGQNYGWPISSYGEPHHWEIKSSKVYEYLKSHKAHGFIEPIYSFVPSIGISEIIKVPNNFSEFWQNNFFVTSLNGSKIYRILFDKNFSKLVYRENIYIGKRIRDIFYIKQFNVFLLALEGSGVNRTPSLGILSNSTN